MSELALQNIQCSDIPACFLQVAIMCDAASRGELRVYAQFTLLAADGSILLKHHAMNVSEYIAGD